MKKGISIIISVMLIMILTGMTLNPNNNKQKMSIEQTKEKFKEMGFEVKGVIEYPETTWDIELDTITITRDKFLNKITNIVILEENEDRVKILYPAIIMNRDPQTVVFKDYKGKVLNQLDYKLGSNRKILKGYYLYFERTGPDISQITCYKEMPEYSIGNMRVYNKKGELIFEVKDMKMEGTMFDISPDGTYIIIGHSQSKIKILYSDGREKVIPAQWMQTIIDNEGDVIYTINEKGLHKLNRECETINTHKVIGSRSVSYLRNGEKYIIISTAAKKIYIYNKESDQIKELVFNDYVKPLLVEDKYCVLESSNRTDSIYVYDIINNEFIYRDIMIDVKTDEKAGVMNIRYANIESNTLIIYIFMSGEKGDKAYTGIYKMDLNEKELISREQVEIVLHADYKGKGIEKLYEYTLNKIDDYYYILK